jgi:hypothetical protein
MASAWFNRGKARVLDGTIDLLNDTIKVLLVSSAYAFDADHNFASQLTEIAGVSGYTEGFGGAGRKTLANKSVTEDDGNDRAYLDADDVAFGALQAGDTIGGAVLVKEATSDADSQIIAFLDLTNTATNGAAFTIVWSANGILRLA